MRIRPHRTPTVGAQLQLEMHAASRLAQHTLLTSVVLYPWPHTLGRTVVLYHARLHYKLDTRHTHLPTTAPFPLSSSILLPSSSILALSGRSVFQAPPPSLSLPPFEFTSGMSPLPLAQRRKEAGKACTFIDHGPYAEREED